MDSVVECMCFGLGGSDVGRIVLEISFLFQNGNSCEKSLLKLIFCARPGSVRDLE